MTTATITLPPVAVLGAGRIGRTLAHDLLDSGAERVVLADADPSRAAEVASAVGDDRLEARHLDVSDASVTRALAGDVACVVSAVPYRLNLELARAAVEAGAHWVDLGGNTEVVERILALGPEAARRGVCVVPDAGLQPGLGNILAGELFRRLGGADSLRVLVGGLPQQPVGRLRYQLVFSIEGLLNEYSGVVRTLDRTQLRHRRPLTGVETLSWPELPEMEAFHTSGSASTLPQSFAGQVGRLEVKTIRYAGHAAELRGVLRDVPPARRVRHLESMLPTEGADLVVMRVEGRNGGRRLAYELEDRFDPATGFTAMMRGTGYPASIVAQLALRGELEPGAVLQERDVPAAPVVEGLRRRGIEVRETS